MRTVERMVYVAQDGKEFLTKEACERYEKACGFCQPQTEAAKSLLIEELNDVKPLQYSGIWNTNLYRWYCVENEEEFDIVCNQFSDLRNIRPEKYPEIVCIEYYEAKGRIKNAIYLLSECIDATNDFFGKFGYFYILSKRDVPDMSKLYGTSKVLTVVDEALRKYPASVISVDLKDEMLHVNLCNHNCNDVYMASVVRFTKCDVTYLQDTLDKRGVRYQW